MTWDFQQCGILTSVDSDEPVQSLFKLRNSKWCAVSSILKRLAKALIRLRVCAGWSEALLVAHTILLEISCTGSIIILSRNIWSNPFCCSPSFRRNQTENNTPLSWRETAIFSIRARQGENDTLWVPKPNNCNMLITCKKISTRSDCSHGSSLIRD